MRRDCLLSSSGRRNRWRKRGIVEGKEREHGEGVARMGRGKDCARGPGVGLGGRRRGERVITLTLYEIEFSVYFFAQVITAAISNAISNSSLYARR